MQACMNNSYVAESRLSRVLYSRDDSALCNYSVLCNSLIAWLTSIKACRHCPLLVCPTFYFEMLQHSQQLEVLRSITICFQKCLKLFLLLLQSFSPSLSKFGCKYWDLRRGFAVKLQCFKSLQFCCFLLQFTLMGVNILNVEQREWHVLCRPSSNMFTSCSWSLSITSS